MPPATKNDARLNFRLPGELKRLIEQAATQSGQSVSEFAVSTLVRSAQGQGLGQLLLVDALRRAEHLAQQLGIRAVEVDAIDDEARRFYAKFGFTPLLDDQNHLFLPMHIIRKLNLPPLHRS